MYKIILILISVCFPFAVWDQSRVTALRARKYIPLKSEYRQLRISPLPVKGNEIDVTSIIIDSSFVSQEDLSGLSASQKRMLDTIASAIKANNVQKALVDWESLITQFRNQPTPINMSGVIGSVNGSVIRDPATDSAKIQTIAAELKYLLEVLRLKYDYLIPLHEQLGQLKADPPVRGDFAVIEDYRQALEEHEVRMADLLQKIQGIQQEIEQIKRKVQELRKELVKLMNEKEGLKLQQLVKRISTMLQNKATDITGASRTGAARMSNTTTGTPGKATGIPPTPPDGG